MRIVQIFWSFMIGGSENMLIDIMNDHCASEDVHLIIFNNVYDDQLLRRLNPKIHVHMLKRKPGSRNPFHIVRFNSLLVKLKPDILHCHDHDLVVPMLLRNLLSIPICLTIHNTSIAGNNYQHYDKLFAISTSVRDILHEKTQLGSDIIYNGINFEAFKQKDGYASCEHFKMVQVGRLHHQIKGQDIVIRAMHDLVHQRHINNISMDFIGEGESKAYLMSLAAELDISPYCNFVGLKDKTFLHGNLYQYDLLVQPSLREGLGITVIEGIAAGLPVLVSNLEGPMEIINKGDHGYMFSAGDAHDCAEKITDIMDEYASQGFVEKMNDAYAMAYSNFDIRKTADEYLKAYYALTQR